MPQGFKHYNPALHHAPDAQLHGREAKCRASTDSV